MTNSMGETLIQLDKLNAVFVTASVTNEIGNLATRTKDVLDVHSAIWGRWPHLEPYLCGCYIFRYQ
jgi:hypothetical protein